MKLHGIAVALHGRMPQLTVTKLSAESKYDILIEETSTIPVQISTVQGLKESFAGLIRAVAHMPVVVATDRTGVPVRLPVIFGVPQSYEAPGLMRAFRTAFAPYLPGEERTAADTPGVGPRQVTVINCVLDEIRLLATNMADDAEFAASTFGKLELKERHSADDPGILASVKELDTWIAELEQRVADGDEFARMMLERHVLDAAESVANDYRRSGTANELRFYQSAPRRVPFIGNKYVNLLRLYDFREKFGKRLIECLGCDNNLAVVTPDDEQNPFVSDIVATHLADKWDAITGDNRRTVVRARRIQEL